MLTVEKVTKKYFGTNAVNGITLVFKPPGIFGIVGPSGSGKTTLLRLITGLEVPDQGRILIDGKEVSTHQKVIPPSKRNLALIFQDLALWPHMTAWDNIEFALPRNGLPRQKRREKIDAALAMMHLQEHAHRYPTKLSGGEQQRLAIARALISEPQYLLMDEPFSNLDPLLKEELKEIVLNLKKDLHIAVIYVTHDIEIALSLSEKIGVINKGVLEQWGNPKDIVDTPQSDFVRDFLRCRITGWNRAETKTV